MRIHGMQNSVPAAESQTAAAQTARLQGARAGLAPGPSAGVGQSAGISLGPEAADAAKQARLAGAAKEFEAMMVNELMKPLKFGQAESTEDGADSTGGGAGDLVRGFATEAMSKALTANGGFGLAKQIVQQVSKEHDRKLGKGEGTKVWEVTADTQK